MARRSNLENTIRRTASETLFILAVSVALALVVNSVRPGGIGIFAWRPGGDGAEGPEAPYRPIPLAEARTFFEERSALFADARPGEDYAAGHIEGAACLALNRFEEWVDEFIDRTAPETLIITYCDGVTCALARALAERLYLVGFENVRYLENGWSRWREADLPTQTGGGGFTLEGAPPPIPFQEPGFREND